MTPLENLNSTADQVKVLLSMRVFALTFLLSTICLPPVTLFAQRLSITPAPVTIVEGETEDIMVVLSTQPTGDVTVAIVPRNGADIRLDRSELTFTPLNWDQPQKVTIMADQDADLSNSNRALILIASGGGYVGNGVTVNPDIALIQSPGETIQLKATIRDQDDAPVTGVVLDWSSADSSIASVDSTGKVTSVSPGLTMIVAAFATAEGSAQTWVGYPSEFTTFTGLRIEIDGSVTLQTGNITLSAGVDECLTGGDMFNGNRFDYHWTAWQRDTGSGWTEVPGTKRTDNKLCGYDLASAMAGQYRLVGDMTLAGVRDNYTSENEAGGGNQSPVTVGTISSLSVNVGEDVSVDDVSPYFSDPDGDILAYTAESSDTDRATAAVSDSTVTVTGVAEGSVTVTVTATDPGGLSAKQSFDVTIQAGNRSPVAVGSISSLSVNEGEDVSLDDVSPYFSDPDGDILTYTATSSDPDLAIATVFDSAVTVTGVAEGSVTITVTATDPGGLSATQSFDVTVAHIAFTAFTGLRIGDGGSVTLQAGGITLAVGAGRCLAGGGSYGGNTYDYHWTAWQQDLGSGWTEVSGSRKTDELCGYDLASATPGKYRLVGDMTLAGVRDYYKSENEVTAGGGGNQPPEAVGSISSMSVIVGNNLSVDDVSQYFSDPDGDILTYTATSSDTGVATASVSGSAVTVTGVTEGNVTITVTATDPEGLYATQSFNVAVQGGGGGNQSPISVGSISSLSVDVGDDVSVDDVSPYFSDPDGDILTYTATSSDTDVATASVSGSAVTVTGVAEGSVTITVTATDPEGLYATQSFNVTIQDVGGGNQSPVAVGSISSMSVDVGDDASVDDVSPYFSDPDGDILTYTATSSDTDLATVDVSGSVVTVSGVAEGTVTITVTATDPGGLHATQSFDVTVQGVGPPVVTLAISVCTGRQITPGVPTYEITIGGTVTTDQDITQVLVEGSANNAAVGVDFVGDIAANQTANFNITGIYLLPPGVTTLTCSVVVNYNYGTSGGTIEQGRQASTSISGRIEPIQ